MHLLVTKFPSRKGKGRYAYHTSITILHLRQLTNAFKDFKHNKLLHKHTCLNPHSNPQAFIRLDLRMNPLIKRIYVTLA